MLPKGFNPEKMSFDLPSEKAKIIEEKRGITTKKNMKKEKELERKEEKEIIINVGQMIDMEFDR